VFVYVGQISNVHPQDKTRQDKTNNVHPRRVSCQKILCNNFRLLIMSRRGGIRVVESFDVYWWPCEGLSPAPVAFREKEGRAGL
jgi:hypothetical protein